MATINLPSLVSQAFSCIEEVDAAQARERQALLGLDPFSDEACAIEDATSVHIQAAFDALRAVAACPCANLYDAGLKAELFISGPEWVREALEDRKLAELFLRSLLDGSEAGTRTNQQGGTVHAQAA